MVIVKILFIIVLLIAGILVLFELKGFRHKLLAFFLIVLVLFGYLSFSLALKEHNINYKSAGGIIDASKIYFSWIGTLIGNFKSITSYAIKQDWKSTKHMINNSRG